MPLWADISLFMIGWACLAGAGWALYMKIQRHEAILRNLETKTDDSHAHD